MDDERSIGAEWAAYPPDWPKCYFCERPVLDRHLTCGRVTCSESAARTILEVKYRESVRLLGLRPR
jgi:hypothetical protein